MREILVWLMNRHGDTPTTLSKRTGVPQPTIYRFVENKVRDMKPENAAKIANLGYAITESQLRGDMPLDIDLTNIKEKIYRTDDPVKQAMIETILALKEGEDSKYAEKSLFFVARNLSRKKSGGKDEVEDDE